MDMNQFWDNITIILAILVAIESLILMLIFRFSKQVTTAWVWSGLTGVNAIMARWTVDRKFKMDIPVIDKIDPFKWSIKQGKLLSPREIKKGSVVTGPDRMDMVIISDDCTSTISLNIDDLTAGKVGSSPGYMQNQLDLAYTEGYNEGFNKSMNTGVWSTITDNLGSVLVVMMMLGIGFFVLQDKFITSTSAYNELRTCNEEKTAIVAKCAPFMDLSSGRLPTTTTSTLVSGTGSVIEVR